MVELVPAAWTYAGIVRIVPHGKRSPRLKLVDSRNLPVAEDPAHQGRSPLQERQLVAGVDDQNVGAVQIGYPVIIVRVISIGQDIRKARSIIRGSGEGIRQPELQSGAEPS